MPLCTFDPGPIGDVSESLSWVTRSASIASSSRLMTGISLLLAATAAGTSISATSRIRNSVRGITKVASGDSVLTSIASPAYSDCASQEKAHSRLIFDGCWLSGTSFATVARDKHVSLLFGGHTRVAIFLPGANNLNRSKCGARPLKLTAGQKLLLYRWTLRQQQ